MTASLNHAQTSRLAVLGSSTHCGGGPDEALGRESQGEAHVRFVGSLVQRTYGAAATSRIVATVRDTIPIALGTYLPIERSRPVAPGGGRSAVASRLRRIATHRPGTFQSLPAGGRSRSRACAFGRQPGPGLPVEGNILPAMLCTRPQIRAALLPSRGRSKPLRIDPNGVQPTVDPAHVVEHLSCVRLAVQTDSERIIGSAQESIGVSQNADR